MRPLNMILGGIPMTATAQGIRRGLPNNLPDSFSRVTRRVPGNKVSWRRVNGGRELARVAQYGAPSQLVGQSGISEASAVMLHSFEHMRHDPLVAQQLISGNAVDQGLAEGEVTRVTADFMERYNSLRTACIYGALSNGKLWFDATGNFLFNSTGAAMTVDYLVPAANKNQLNGIIAASWALAGTDIAAHITALKKRAARDSQYPIRYAFYGENVPGYLANNTVVSKYLTANPAFAQALYTGGEIAPGFMGLQWRPIYEAFGTTAAGVVTDISGPDTVIFAPEPDPTWYEVVEGGYLIPSTIEIQRNVQAALGSVQQVFGKFSYASVSHDPVTVVQYAGDTFLPIIKVPSAIYIADVTP